MFSGFLSGHDERFVKGIISDSVNWVIVHGHPINEECLRHVSNACHAWKVSIRFLAWRRPKLTFRTYSSYCDRTWTFPTLLPLFEKFLISLKTSIPRLSRLRWCCARRLATIRKDDFKRNTTLQPFDSLSQQCSNAVLRWKSSLRIVSCNITFILFSSLTKRELLTNLRNKPDEVNRNFNPFRTFANLYLSSPENFKEGKLII